MQDQVRRQRYRRQGEEDRDRHRRHHLWQRRRAGEAASTDEILSPRKSLLDSRRQEKAHRHLRKQARF
jgi:hypothetical protein